MKGFVRGMQAVQHLSTLVVAGDKILTFLSETTWSLVGSGRKS